MKRKNVASFILGLALIGIIEPVAAAEMKKNEWYVEGDVLVRNISKSADDKYTPNAIAYQVLIEDKGAKNVSFMYQCRNHENAFKVSALNVNLTKLPKFDGSAKVKLKYDFGTEKGWSYIATSAHRDKILIPKISDLRFVNLFMSEEKVDIEILIDQLNANGEIKARVWHYRGTFGLNGMDKAYRFSNANCFGT